MNRIAQKSAGFLGLIGDGTLSLLLAITSVYFISTL
jgi:hypothetical protein